MPQATSSASSDPDDLAAELARLPMSDALRALALRGVVQQHAKGRLVIREGDRGDTLYIVIDGELRVFAAADSGREIVYGHFGPGDYVGEMSLDGGLRSASVETTRPSRLAMVTRQTLLQHIAAHPEFAIELLGRVIRRARAMTQATRRLALEDAYGRLRLLLEELAGPPGPDGLHTVAERLTHREMAARIGCGREMVSRLMKDLLRGGLLREEGRGWVFGTLPERW